MIPFEVIKKRDGFMVLHMDSGRIDYLYFFEGLRWRFLGKLPARVWQWPEVRGVTQ